MQILNPHEHSWQDFKQVSPTTWYSDNIQDLHSLADGDSFFVLYSPIPDVSQEWQLRRFRVGQAPNLISEKMERHYFVMKSYVLTEKPEGIEI